MRCWREAVLIFLLFIFAVTNCKYTNVGGPEREDQDIDQSNAMEAAKREHMDHSTPPTPLLNTFNQPKRVEFDYSTNIDTQPELNTTRERIHFAEGSPEDLDNSQWYIVTQSGYEFDGSPKVPEALFAKTGLGRDGPKGGLGFPVSDREAFKNGSKRARIYNPAQHLPYVVMGRIELGCTGTFIGPRHILTAGHCVFNHTSQEWYQNLNFNRAKDCDPDTGMFYRWKYAITVKGWKENGYHSYDYGMIIVDSYSPYMDIGWSGITLDWIININGYPGNKLGRCQWHSDCKVLYVFDEQLGYHCSTNKGTSGSAVYSYWSSTNTRIIYCIHAYGGSSYNSCTRITESRYNQLKEWIRDY